MTNMMMRTRKMMKRMKTSERVAKRYAERRAAEQAAAGNRRADVLLDVFDDQLRAADV